MDQVITPDTYFNNACTHALSGEIEAALEELRKAFAENPDGKNCVRGRGYTCRQCALEDPDFDLIRDDPRFKQLVGLSQ